MIDAQELITLSYGNIILPQYTMVKFLGVYLDCFLSFRPHMAHLRSFIRCTRLTYFFHHMLWLLFIMLLFIFTFFIAAFSGVILINLFSAHLKETKIGQ